MTKVVGLERQSNNFFKTIRSSNNGYDSEGHI